MKNYGRQHRAELTAYMREWRNRPGVRDRVNGQRRKAGFRLRERDRKAIVEKFGGKCVGCGFTDWRALQIDHLKGNGAEERRLHGPHYAQRRILNLPIKEIEDEYQLLCANCNRIKEYNAV